MFKKFLVALQISLVALICCFCLGSEAHAQGLRLSNARVSGDFFYVRDSSGNVIPGEIINDGSSIGVLDVSYSKQLTLVNYRKDGIIKTGYIKNVPSLIKYEFQNMYQNGSTRETVYDENGNQIGSLDPWEKATPLYSMGNRLCVVYNTGKGQNTKSGFVNYWGGFSFPNIIEI